MTDFEQALAELIAAAKEAETALCAHDAIRLRRAREEVGKRLMDRQQEGEPK